MNNSLAHKSENVYNLNDILIRDHDVRTYFMGPHKILHFAGSGHPRILELWGGNLLSRDPLNIVHFCIRQYLYWTNYEDTFLTKIINCKGACSLSTFSMEKPGLGYSFQTFRTHREGRRELERNMDLLIWLTRELSH